MPPREALEVERLTVAFAGDGRPVVRGVSFTVASGEAFGLVGESGSGKSLTCRAILRLLPRGAAATGRIRYGGHDLFELTDGQMQADFRVNGIDYPAGAAALVRYAQSWPDRGLEYRKQYVCIQTRAGEVVSGGRQVGQHVTVPGG